MKLAIMQPYLFPYIGYFQLIHAVDAFVVYDDVNYINRGWINRNNLLSNGTAELISLETTGASQNKLINQVGVGGNGNKLLKNIQHKYSKAPQFIKIFPLIENVLLSDEKNLSRFLDNALKAVCRYLGLRVDWHLSSEIKKDNTLKGQEKILEICEILHSTHYINPPGGKLLYDHDLFISHGIELSFIETKCLKYPQFGREFVPYLSIIDVMMFNDTEQYPSLLKEYSLV